MAPILINLYKSIDEVLAAYNESPQTQHKDYRGIVVLPNDPLPYTQYTNHPTGIELEDATVKVFSKCGKELGVITSSFLLDAVFDDDFGKPQIQWSLQSVPIDFGPGLVYLEITQTIGEIFYTNLFQITRYEEKFVTRFDYWDSRFSKKQSVGIRTWYRQTKNADTQSNYFEKSTGRTRSLTTAKQRPEVMFTNTWSNWLWEKMVDLLECRWVYRNLQRAALFETPEIPEVQGDANFIDGEYLLAIDKTDTYNPIIEVPVQTFPENIDVQITGKKESGRYFLSFVFFSPFDYNIVQTNQSYANFNTDGSPFNNQAVSFPQNRISVLSGLVGGAEGWNVSMETSRRSQNPLPNSIVLKEFNIRMTNGNAQYELNFDLIPDEVFSPSDILNGIVKTFTVPVTIL